jgi:hypothetical protein
MKTLQHTNLSHFAELKVSPALLRARFKQGCAISTCDAACCTYGVLVDVQQKAQILAHADVVRGLMDLNQDDDPGHWFDDEVIADRDFPSGYATSTRIKDGRCGFLNRSGRCVLQMATNALGSGGIDLKPFYCTLFPVTIEDRVLMLDPNLRGPATCCGECPDGELTVLDVCSKELQYVLGHAGVEDLRRLISRARSESSSEAD